MRQPTYAVGQQVWVEGRHPNGKRKRVRGVIKAIAGRYYHTYMVISHSGDELLVYEMGIEPVSAIQLLAEEAE